MTLQFVYVNCPLCGVNENRIIFPSTKKNPKKVQQELFNCTNDNLGEYNNDIVKCNKCGMIYSNPQPTQKELSTLYKSVIDNKYLEETAAREKTFNLSLKQLHRFITPPGKLMDIGCYTGTFMETAKDKGWTVSGIELSDWASNIAKNKNIGKVYNKPINKLLLPYENFDLITLWDVIEHLPNPKQILKDLSRFLKPDGIIALSTHFIDSLSARILGKHYPFLMDMHLSHFSQKTIKRILNDSGFEIIKIYPHKRILRSGYFLDKLSNITPVGGRFISELNKNKYISERFIRVGLLGLKNIYCKKIR